MFLSEVHADKNSGISAPLKSENLDLESDENVAR